MSIQNQTHLTSKQAQHFRRTLKLALVGLLPFLLSEFNGCKLDDHIKPLDLGPEVSADAVAEAVSAPTAKLDPLNMKVGEFFVYSDTQEIPFSGSVSVSADTSQTLIEKTETVVDPQNSVVAMTIIQHKQSYQNGQVLKTATEIPIKYQKKTTASSKFTEEIGPVQSSPETSSVTVPQVRTEAADLFGSSTPNEFYKQLRALGVAKKTAGMVQAAADRITFHKLAVTNEVIPAPTLVAQSSQCQGLVGCKIHVTKVEFDMVFWAGDSPDRIHWEMLLSSEVPYLASLLNKCMTGQVTVPSTTGRAPTTLLLRQCQPVVNFKFGT